MNQFKRKNGFMLLALIGMILVFTGCQSPKQERVSDTVNKSNTLTFMMPAEASTYDPDKSVETYSGIVLDHCFERLVAHDQKGNIVPAAATAWTLSKDGKTYTFNLRKEAKWSDGKSVSAEDFRNSWLRLLDPKNKFGNASALSPYIVNADAYASGKTSADQVGIKVVNPLTLEVQLNSPTPFFLSLITMWNYSPVRMDIINQYGEGWDKKVEAFVCNGPYQLTDYRKDEYMLLGSNKTYWNSKAIKIANIKLVYYSEGQDSYKMFKDGEIDGMYQIFASDMRNLSDLKPYVRLEESLSTAFLVINHKNPLLKDPTFREALEVVIDRQKIVNDLLLGAGTASRYLVPPSLMMASQPFHEFTDLTKPVDLKHGKKLIQKMKSEKKNLNQKLRFFYMYGGPDEKSVSNIAEAWKKELGLQIEVQGMSWSELFERCQKGDYDIAMFGYGADYPHPMNFLSLFSKDAVVSNILGWSDATWQQQLMAVMRLQNEKEALRTLRALELKVIDENHIIPLYHRKVICLMSGRISGWYRDELSHFRFQEAQILPYE